VALYLSRRSEPLPAQEGNLRPAEWIIASLYLPAVLWLILAKETLPARILPMWLRFLTAAASVAMLLQVFVEEPYWQMTPIYVATLILMYLMAAPRTRHARLAGAFVAILLVAGIAISAVLPMFHLPPPTGPYPVGTRTEFFIDHGRHETHPGSRPGNREVPVQLWYPSATTEGKHAVYRRWRETTRRSSYQAVLQVDSLQDAPVAAGRFPVVILNHSWRSFSNRSTFIAQDLASHGFIVVAPSHAWNAAATELHDGFVADGKFATDLGNFSSQPPLTFEQRRAFAEAEMKIQVDDDKFVLDQLEKLDRDASTPYAGHLNVAKVGALGHSFGGTVSAEFGREDPRVMGVIGLDSGIYGPVAQEGLNKPLMMVTGPIVPFDARDLASPDLPTRVRAQWRLVDKIALDATYARFGGYDVQVAGINHQNFSDQAFFSPSRKLTRIGDLPQARFAVILNRLIVAFFTQTLKGEPEPLLDSTSQPFPEAKLVVYKPQGQSQEQQTPVAMLDGSQRH
jgi:dienelactone hydrolase